MFSYEIKGSSGTVDFYAKSNLVYFMDVFKKFCSDNEYDWEAVELLGILQYFNISKDYIEYMIKHMTEHILEDLTRPWAVGPANLNTLKHIYMWYSMEM